MNEKELQKFKSLLEDMKVKIMSDVEQTLSEMTTQTGNIPDPNDRATVESDRNFELRIRDRERKLRRSTELMKGITVSAKAAERILPSSGWRQGLSQNTALTAKPVRNSGKKPRDGKYQCRSYEKILFSDVG